MSLNSSDVVRTPTPEELLPGVLGVLGRSMAWLNRVILFLASAALLGAALILCSSVFLRYFFKMPTDWQDEASVFLLVGATFFCAPYVQSQRGHIGIGLLANWLPSWANRVRAFLCDVASFLFCGFFTWKSWALVHEAWVEGQTTSSTWAPPLWIPYSLMAVGMSLLSLQILLQITTHLTRKAN